MSPALEELRQALVALHAGGSSAGLDPRAADAFVGSLERGTDLGDAARSAGLEPRIAAAAAESTDLPAAVTAVARAAADTHAATRRLRRAAIYPATLCVSVVFCGASVGLLALPALKSSPGFDPAIDPLGLALFAVPMLLLMALTAVASLSVPVPVLLPGVRRVERFGFLQVLHALVSSGAGLPAALRGAGQFLARPATAAALADALEAGQDAQPSVLDAFETSLLFGSARAGAEAEACAALADTARVALRRDLPADVARIQFASLLLAGLALGVVGATLFSSYGHALVG